MARKKRYGPDEAWAVFPDVPDRKFTNFDEVKATIENLTDQASGGAARCFEGVAVAVKVSFRWFIPFEGVLRAFQNRNLVDQV